MEVYQWSTAAGSNASTGSVSITEGCDPGNLNDAARDMMAAIAKVIGPNGIGYITGQGGAVTQLTDKSTAVTLNKPAGQITTHNASLASGASVAFLLNSSYLEDTDVLLVNLKSAGGGAHGILDYTVRAGQPQAGVAAIMVKNETGGALAETLVINFVIFKGKAA